MAQTEMDLDQVRASVQQLVELYNRVTEVQVALAEVTREQGPHRWSSVAPAQGFTQTYSSNLSDLHRNMANLARNVLAAAKNLQDSAAAMLAQDQATADDLARLLAPLDAETPAPVSSAPIGY